MRYRGVATCVQDNRPAVADGGTMHAAIPSARTLIPLHHRMLRPRRSTVACAPACRTAPVWDTVARCRPARRCHRPPVSTTGRRCDPPHAHAQCQRGEWRAIIAIDENNASRRELQSTRTTTATAAATHRAAVASVQSSSASTSASADRGAAALGPHDVHRSVSASRPTAPAPAACRASAVVSTAAASGRRLGVASPAPVRSRLAPDVVEREASRRERRRGAKQRADAVHSARAVVSLPAPASLSPPQTPPLPRRTSTGVHSGSLQPRQFSSIAGCVMGFMCSDPIRAVGRVVQRSEDPVCRCCRAARTAGAGVPRTGAGPVTQQAAETRAHARCPGGPSRTGRDAGGGATMVSARTANSNGARNGTARLGTNGPAFAALQMRPAPCDTSRHGTARHCMWERGEAPGRTDDGSQGIIGRRQSARRIAGGAPMTPNAPICTMRRRRTRPFQRVMDAPAGRTQRRRNDGTHRDPTQESKWTAEHGSLSESRSAIRARARSDASGGKPARRSHQPRRVQRTLPAQP